jgi:hypothetical protein
MGFNSVFKGFMCHVIGEELEYASIDEFVFFPLSSG